MKIYYYKIETEKFNVIILTVQGFFCYAGQSMDML